MSTGRIRCTSPIAAAVGPRTAAGQRGVSMLELLIGLGLGLVVVAIITSFFGPASEHRRQLENTGQMFDNATLAAELLSDEIRAAGFLGELQSANVVWQAADPCALVHSQHVRSKVSAQRVSIRFAIGAARHEARRVDASALVTPLTPAFMLWEIQTKTPRCW